MPLIQEVEEHIPDRLVLTPVEATLRRLLLDVAQYIEQSTQHENIVLRFTGGWVRDKLLGADSHDIDVAINCMTGEQFGLKLKEYLEVPENAAKYGLEGVATTDKQDQQAGTTDRSKIVGGLHKIEANPERSKHLETITTRLLGVDLDLVNLRKETYTDDSRNPQVEFGTPEEDALRRDATVNAMFYNLNTEEVEDFTGRGHEDMKAKILRTPLEPYQTFKDDPLRVLRLIRFASRLGYQIDRKAMQAMQDPDTKDALRRKISRERVGIELEKALRGPDPEEALRLIFELNLYETIFCDPTVDPANAYSPQTTGWQEILRTLSDTLNTEGDLDPLVRDDEDRFLAWQLAAMVPYNDAPQPEPPAPGRKAPPPIAAQVAREGIKATNKVCDIIAASVRNQPEIASLVDRLDTQRRRPDKKLGGEDPSARDVLGMAIRRWGPSWRTQVMYSLLAEVASPDNSADGVVRKYGRFVATLSDLALLDAYLFKPLMDGKALAKALNTSPGPWMKDALDVVMQVQLRNPDTVTEEEAIAEVQKHLHDQNGNAQGNGGKNQGGELTSSLVRHFLTLTIRPLFIKAKPSSVTETGRRNVTTVLSKKMSAQSIDESVSKPWKNDLYALDLLRWCVAALDEKLVEQCWHLLVPPVLTLVDDWEIRYRQLGVELLAQLLEVTSPSLLAKTGLGEVFEDALMPCLTYLPTLTPEAECIPLLDAVYPALLILSHVRYPEAAPSNSKNSPSQTAQQRTKFLDTILRKGIIYSYTHCTTYPNIVSLLFRHLATILNELRIFSVKHLQYILPMFTEIMSNDLAAAHLDSMLSATKALQAVILNAWPRMPHHRGEVLRALTFGWLVVCEREDEKGVEEVKRVMKEAVAMLKCALGDQVELGKECEMLVEAEPRVQGLFDEVVAESKAEV